MRKLVVFLIVLCLFSACNKKEEEIKGPTYLRYECSDEYTLNEIKTISIMGVVVLEETGEIIEVYDLDVFEFLSEEDAQAAIDKIHNSSSQIELTKEGSIIKMKYTYSKSEAAYIIEKGIDYLLDYYKNNRIICEIVE